MTITEQLAEKYFALSRRADLQTINLHSEMKEAREKAAVEPTQPYIADYELARQEWFLARRASMIYGELCADFLEDR